MNRFITSNDLARLSNKAWKLAKISEAARTMAGDLTSDKTAIKDVHGAINQCRIRLRSGTATTMKRRRKIERKLQFYEEWLDHSGREVEDKTSGFSEAICQIEAVLRELAETGKTLGKVQRFEHTA
jgi:hypothetical protein